MIVLTTPLIRVTSAPYLMILVTSQSPIMKSLEHDQFLIAEVLKKYSKSSGYATLLGKFSPTRGYSIADRRNRKESAIEATWRDTSSKRRVTV